MKVGVLDLLTTPARPSTEAAYNVVMTKQYASITPQAIAVWWRQAGHRTRYATYHGIGDSRRASHDLAVVFLASYTQARAFAAAGEALPARRSGCPGSAPLCEVRDEPLDLAFPS
jgi:hypothetical protein